MRMLVPDDEVFDVDAPPIEKRRRDDAKRHGLKVQERLLNQRHDKDDIARLVKEAEDQGPIEEVLE